MREFPRATGRNTLRRALVKAAHPVAVVARSIAPDDPATGAPDLKNSIEVTTQLTSRHRGEKVSEVEVYIGPVRQVGRFVLNYASLVEFGTYKMTAQPFMRPAWDRMKGIVHSRLVKELATEFEKAGRRIDRKFNKILSRNFKG